MAKSFSQQLQDQNNQQEQGRLSRTQRKQIQDYERTQQEKFNQLRQQADVIRSSSFMNITSIDQYRAEYGKLSPDLQQFFATPDEVLAEQDKAKTLEKDKANQTLQKWQSEVERRKQDLEKLRTWWGNKSSKYRSDPRNRENYNEDRDRYEEDIEEAEDKVRYLQNEYGKLDQGFGAEDLINYAEDKADYQRRKSEAKRDAIKKFESDVSSGKLDEVLTKLNLGKNVKFDEFNKSIDKYNKNIDYLKGLQNWGTKVGFQNLPEWALEKINPSAVEFQKKNPTEKLQYDKSGNVVGVESGAFGMSLDINSYNFKIEDYNKKLQSQKTPEQLKAEAKLYLTDYSTKVSDTSFDAPEKSTWGKAFDYLKAGYLSTPFGSSMKLPESSQKELTKIKETKYLGFYVPYGKSLDAIKEADQSTFRAGEKAELFGELNEKVKNAPDELKYYVQEEGLNLLKAKGLQFKVEDVNLFQYKDGKIVGVEKLGEQVIVTDPDFDRRISQNILEWEKEKKKEGWLGEAVLGTRIVSTKAVEFLAISKGVGFAVGKVAQGGGWLYKSLGGGLKIADATVKGGSVTATLDLTFNSPLGRTILKIGKYAWTGTKYSVGTGLFGLYGYSKYQQYKSYKQTSEVGGEVFALETSGELLGLGIAVGEDIYSKYQTKKLNQQIARENALLEQKRSGLKNIKDYGQYSDKASIKYDQVGVGKPVKLSNQQLRSVAKDYADVTGISERDAMRIIREKSIYKTTLNVKSNVPSTERALKYLRSGKGSQGDDIYRISRYGFTDQIKSSKGVEEVAFEFNLKGSRISNLQVKTTIAEDQMALTNIFEKARYSKKTPDEILKLKETVLTKVTKSQTGEYGDLKLLLTNTENRLLKSYPYGNERFTVKEAMQLGLEKGQLQNFDNLWTKAGSVGKTATFSNVRIENPLWQGSKDLKFALEGEYKFLQKGVGKRELALKNILYDLEKGGYFKKIEQTWKAPKVQPISDMLASSPSNIDKLIASETSKSASSNLLKDTIKQKALTETMQISPTVQSFAVSTKVALKETIKNIDRLFSDVAVGLSSESILSTKTKSQQKASMNLQQKNANAQMEKLMQNLGQKQAQQQKYKQANVEQLIQELQSPRFQVPELLSPRVNIRETTFKPRKFVLPDFDTGNKKEKLKRQIKQKRMTELGLLPDFTSRVLGLEAEEFSMKDVNKAIRSVQTGFEVRRGARIKGFKENDLMKEVLKWQ